MALRFVVLEIVIGTVYSVLEHVGSIPFVVYRIEVAHAARRVTVCAPV